MILFSENARDKEEKDKARTINNNKGFLGLRNQNELSKPLSIQKERKGTFYETN